jgi:beta-glucosidase
VKNVNGALPLKKPRMLSLFGYDAVAPAINAQSTGFSFQQSLGLSNSLAFPDGEPLSYEMLAALFVSALANVTGPGIALNGTLISGGGSGSNTPSYIDAPFNAFQRQAKDDRTFLSWDFYSQNPAVNAASDACIVFVNEQASEGWDRPSLADVYSDAIIINVAEQCNNTMVVVHNAGARVVDAWIEHPNITAVILAHVPGQDSGSALVEIMYGKQSPSGRLPYTVARNESDYGTLLAPVFPDNSSSYFTQSNFTEGLHIDYRYFIAKNITPRYEFGHGLTYTTFEYHNLTIETDEKNMLYFPPGHGVYNESAKIPEGGLSSLWETVATVNCTVTNSGSITAAEASQLYIRMPGNEPDRVLRGFQKQSISPGDSAHVSFPLMRRDLSQWDTVMQQWVLHNGIYEIMVGRSVLNIALHGTLSVAYS